MLRAFIAIIAIGLLAAGAVLLFAAHAGFPLLIMGVILLISLFFEGRYRGSRPETGGTWQATGEKFIDPGTGQFVEVDYDPTTGERNYRQT